MMHFEVENVMRDVTYLTYITITLSMSEIPCASRIKFRTSHQSKGEHHFHDTPATVQSRLGHL